MPKAQTMSPNKKQRKSASTSGKSSECEDVGNDNNASLKQTLEMSDEEFAEKLKKLIPKNASKY